MNAWPIDWCALVAEAIRRRKSEGLTQRSLAALAGVSAPTVNAFEQGAINLRFERIVAILEALGLFVLPGRSDDLATFIENARARWRELVDELPAEDPSRQPHGHSEQAYAIDLPDQDLPSLQELRRLLAQAPRTSGWSPFWLPPKQSVKPAIRDGVVECWLSKIASDQGFSDAAHSDFWQVSRRAQAYLQRGLQEDGADFEPGLIFDMALPVTRTAEMLRHAVWLANQFEADDTVQIRFAARYTGLAGRELLAWSRPALRDLVRDRHRARADSVDLTYNASLSALKQNLPEIVHDALRPLYERFDGFVLPFRVVETVNRR